MPATSEGIFENKTLSSGQVYKHVAVLFFPVFLVLPRMHESAKFAMFFSRNSLTIRYYQTTRKV